MHFAELASLGISSHRLSKNPSDARRRIVFIFAHPDDETFACGGSIARYAAAGAAVHYICATRGECGTIAPELLGEHTVAEFRTAELLGAAHTLGLEAVHFLNYRDSGMSATPDNAHREAFTAAPEAEVVGKLVALLRAIRPQVVITHGPYGGYGHPDHIRVYETVTAAFALAHDPLADAAHQDEGLVPWLSRLYYTTFDARPARLFIALLRLLRRDPSRYGEHGDINLLEAARQITPVTCTIDVEPWQALKERAYRCYRSQLGFFAYVLRLPRPVRKVFLAREFYTRAIPPVAPGEAHERDFFSVEML